MSDLSHFDAQGASRMVDVAAKPVTLRQARAESFVTLQSTTLERILNRQMTKGDVLEVARLAGIMATKRTSDLIPLCHPLGLEGVDVSLQAVSATSIRIEAHVRVHGRTGVEMEALTAVSVAGLTVYDMCKAIDRGIVLGPTRLLEKTGGKSGDFSAPETA